jgi:Papain family cysteine protease
MANTFLDRFQNEANLTGREADVLRQVGVRSAEDVDSLVKNFPSIVDVGVRLNVVSNAAAQHLSSAYSSVAASVGTQSPQIGLGANPPPNTPVTGGTVVGSAPPPLFGIPLAPTTSIDLRVLPWPVRNQGQRGTCVAFGTTACVEHLQSATEGPNPDYSEQFLYWAIKDHSADPNRSADGTWLRFARDMLQSDGICRENLWPYTTTVINPVSGPGPSANARADAANHKLTAGTYISKPSGAAVLVLQLLQHGRPVAISLPVFSDPTVPNGPINWATSVGWAYGRVLNPPPKSVVTGGHCVCVTGFVPDPAEPNGGYFIVRNSWDTQWATLARCLQRMSNPIAGNSCSCKCVDEGELGEDHAYGYYRRG